MGTGPRRSTAEGAEGFTHLLVVVDKFSKQAVLFFTDIVFRFGVPNSIITDNGTQFTGKKFLAFCDSFHIRVDWSAMAHPQTNGQVERANGMILQGLKPRIFNKLNKFGRRWLTELPSVIWSLRTTPSRATGFTRSSSSMAPRPYSPRTWSTGRQGSRHTKSSKTSEPARTHWIKWTRLETWHFYTLRVISSPCEDIKRTEFGAETSTKGTWC